MQHTPVHMNESSAFEAMLSLVGEAVVLFDASGSVLRINHAASRLLGYSLDDAVGRDVKDFFYTVDLSRPQAGIFPFGVDGSPEQVMAKAADGSFVCAVVRCQPVSPLGPYILVAYQDVMLESQGERDRLLAQIQHLNDRLYGTLSIISSASLGEGSFESLAARVANELERLLRADAAVIYLADESGFTPYGVSDGFESLGVEMSYLPKGLGVPALVTRNRRTTRLQLVSPPSSPEAGSVMLDLDMDARFRLRSMLAECCSTVVGTPVFSYGRIVAVVVVGWLSPYRVSSDDVQLLDTVAQFLSVEFAAAVTQMEQKRSSEFLAAMAQIRDLVRSEREMSTGLANSIAQAVSAVVPSQTLIMESNSYTNTTVIRLRSAHDANEVETIEFPYGMADVFAETNGFVEISPSSQCGMWVGRHTDLSNGYGVLLTSGDAAGNPLQVALLVMRGPLDRPFDSSERSFMLGISNEVGSTLHAEQTRVHDARIAKALQAGLRNELPEKARGLSTGSLYISATESAVVGGDFFDLYELSNNRVVLVMGDVSGKGVESAAMASLVKTALAAYAWNFLDPASMLSSLNNLFLNFSRLETFASMVVVSIDCEARRALYCSAGHPPAMLVRTPEDPSVEIELLTVQSPIVGAFEGLEYTNGSFEYRPGDILFLYTDGTTEARGPQGAFFGEDALRITLLKSCKHQVGEIPQLVLNEVRGFAGEQLHDDIALVALRFDDLDSSHSGDVDGRVEVASSGAMEYGDLDAVLDGLFTSSFA